MCLAISKKIFFVKNQYVEKSVKIIFYLKRVKKNGSTEGIPKFKS